MLCWLAILFDKRTCELKIYWEAYDTWWLSTTATDNATTLEVYLVSSGDVWRGDESGKWEKRKEGRKRQYLRPVVLEGIPEDSRNVVLLNVGIPTNTLNIHKGAVLPRKRLFVRVMKKIVYLLRYQEVKGLGRSQEITSRYKLSIMPGMVQLTLH